MKYLLFIIQMRCFNNASLARFLFSKNYPAIALSECNSPLSAVLDTHEKIHNSLNKNNKYSALVKAIETMGLRPEETTCHADEQHAYDAHFLCKE